MGVGGSHLLLALFVRPLTTHPLRVGALCGGGAGGHAENEVDWRDPLNLKRDKRFCISTQNPPTHNSLPS